MMLSLLAQALLKDAASSDLLYKLYNFYKIERFKYNPCPPALARFKEWREK